MTVEKWMPVPGFEGTYSISSMGSVRNDRRNRLLTPQVDGNGRYKVMLFSRGKGKNYLIHRLVAEAFFGPAPESMVACHNDGNKLNNQVINIRWGTQKENIADKVRHGTALKGTQCHSAKLFERQVFEIREASFNGETQVSLARRYNISSTSVRKILQGKTWSWL